MITNDYIITKVHKYYDILNLNTNTLYTVNMERGNETCNCPHWIYRIKKVGSRCKHHDIVDTQGAWNEGMENLDINKLLVKRKRTSRKKRIVK